VGRQRHPPKLAASTASGPPAPPAPRPAGHCPRG
jgi:hypothetical protein